ncbi:MAG: PAS domain-containing sensor histidine kinase [Actinobacteria bacterium]|nr:PAS domain-containing sensor histidine kinase [Actinomycetota bacterium]MBU2112112.1 PAS domain-containing sensor histidine kinase [Actinomycetota bacterium]
MGMLRIERIGVGLAVLAAVTSFSNLQVAPHPDHVLAVWSVGPAVIAASLLPRSWGVCLAVALPIGLAVAAAYWTAGYPPAAVLAGGAGALVLTGWGGALLRREVGLRLHDAGDLGHLLSVTGKVGLASAVQGVLVELAVTGGVVGLMPLSYAVTGASSLLTLVPLVADLPSHAPLGRRRERVVQRTLAALLIVLALLPAGAQVLSLLLLPTVIAWGALRVSARESLAQMYGALVSLMAATLLGTGAFIDAGQAFALDDDGIAYVVTGYAFVLALTACGALLFAADQVERTEAAARQRDLLQQVLDATPGAAIVGIDADGDITDVNVGVRRLLGHDAADLLGGPADILYADGELERLAGELGVRAELSSVAAALAERPGAVAVSLRRADGAIRQHQLTFAPLRDSAGRPRGHLATSEDVTELLAATRALEESLARQVAVDRAKDAFVSTVSHELRTPLTSILGNAELVADMLEEPVDQESQEVLRGAVARIGRGGDRLLALVDDLLAHSAVEDPVPREVVDVADVVRDACARLSPGTDLRAIRLDLPDRAMHVVGRRGHLADALGHVLENAVKFSAGRPDIRVRTQQDATQVLILVQDSGIGIPAAEVDRVVEPFVRGSNAMRRQIQGAGLGLGLARTILTGYGGSLRLESTEGAGTRVRLALPVPGLGDSAG